MLTTLYIQNIVLIQDLTLDFQRGLSVFTGETGAGKSVILDALSLVLGGRGDTSLIRFRTEKATVIATFTLSENHPVKAVLAEQEIDGEDEVNLKRVLTKDGKSRAFVNGQPVGLAQLKQIGQMLVEIHGQFSSYQLLQNGTHLGVLDAYAGLQEERAVCQRLYTDWRLAQQQYVAEQSRQDSARQRADEIAQTIEELTQAHLIPDEEEQLCQQRTVLAQQGKITENMSLAYQTLTYENQGILSLIYRLQHALEKANDLSAGLCQEALSKTEQGIENLLDVEAFLQEQLSAFADGSALEKVENRLFFLRDLARKYHVPVSGLPPLLAQAEQMQQSQEQGKNTLKALDEMVHLKEQAYLECAQHLHETRVRYAQKLEEVLQDSLPALKLSSARFHVDLTAQEAGAFGLDGCVFTASTNKGMPLQALGKIASGGELARFMLALKEQLAMAQHIDVMVFDEVDTGISGAVSDAVGAKLKALAQAGQVLVITHSPQVAAFADEHYRVQKSETLTGMQISVEALSMDARIQEVARMLSGAVISPESLAAAKCLLKDKA